VCDDGCGISLENQGKLFKLFGYLHETNNMNTKGVGLGLYITKMIVGTFGGVVSVNSEQGKGSRFNLNFKLSDNTINLREILREVNPI
jgi:K+-sensing histidine kinase KdpD